MLQLVALHQVVRFQRLYAAGCHRFIVQGIAMSSSAKAEAVLALHRFGMGPRPGLIAAIEADPVGR